MNNLTNQVKTKSGTKLMFGALMIILIGLGIFIWGLIRFLIVNPGAYVLDTSNRRHRRRQNKLDKINTKEQLKTKKKEVK